jgi:hypothetical protein
MGATRISAVAITALWMSLACGAASAEELAPVTIAKQGYFFVGGKYVDTPAGPVIAGQAYVEFQIPRSASIPIRSS